MATPDFHIVRKYNDGWVIRHPKTDTVSFLDNEKLSQMGYISPSPPLVVQSPPFSAPKVIIVPADPPRRGPDLDTNWRSRSLPNSSPLANFRPHQGRDFKTTW